MSDIYTIVTPILAGVAALSMTAAGYLLYRQKEIIELGKEVIDAVVVTKNAYEDKNISEEEYNKIVKELSDIADKLKDVIYKK